MKRSTLGVRLNMRIIFLLMICILPAYGACSDKPNSLKLWEERATYFWSLDFSNEVRFKEKLIAYYERIYGGELLDKMKIWINDGNLESEYFSLSFSDYKETSVLSVNKKSKYDFLVSTEQKSCYDLSYNPPVMENIVENYKVINYSQDIVDKWLIKEGQNVKAEVCMKIERIISFVLSDRGKVISEKWSTIKSLIELKPNKILK